MFKLDHGWIENPETGERKQIVVNVFNQKGIKNLLIGGGITIFGITYIAISQFRNGAYSYEEAEYKTLENLELFK